MRASRVKVCDGGFRLEVYADKKTGQILITRCEGYEVVGKVTFPIDKAKEVAEAILQAEKEQNE